MGGFFGIIILKEIICLKCNKNGNNKFEGEKKYESYDNANPWGCTHTHTQALLSVEEKKQKNKINKFNKDGKRSIIQLCFLLPSFCMVGCERITILDCVRFHLKRGYIHHVCALAF